jgi:hypothetical protein
MSPHETPWWLFIAGPLGLIAYLALLLGVLWLAVRVVRHAWYWRMPGSNRQARVQLDIPFDRSDSKV